MRAAYFLDHPDKALMEIRAETLRRLAFVTQTGITQGPLFDARKLEADEAIAAFPEVAKFKLVPFEQMIPDDEGKRAKVYSMHYRMPSQRAHGTVLSFQQTMKIDDGVIQTAFDSRENGGEINDLFGTLANYVLSYCQVVAKAFEAPLPNEVPQLIADNRAVDLRLNPESLEDQLDQDI